MSSSLLITREEFIKLIKFGEIKMCINSVIGFNGQELTSILSYKSFDDELGFLILDFKSRIEVLAHNVCCFDLKIDDIEEIFCLTPKALNFYKSKFDSRIDFQLLNDVDNVINQVNVNQVVNDRKKGIEVLYEIFQVEKSNQSIKFSSSDFNDDLINKILTYQKDGYLKQPYKSWEFDLFCYERKGNFLDNDFSFVLDLRTLSILKHRKLEDINLFYSQNLNDRLLRNGESVQNMSPLDKLLDTYKESIKNNPKLTSDQKKELEETLLVGGIFLKAKTLLEPENRKTDSWTEFLNFVRIFIDKYQYETIKALFLLGVYLGYKNLYDDYYGWKQLLIFKKKYSIESNKKLDGLGKPAHETAHSAEQNQKISSVNNVNQTIISDNGGSKRKDKPNPVEIADNQCISNPKRGEDSKQGEFKFLNDTTSQDITKLHGDHYAKFDSYGVKDLKKVVDSINEIEGKKEIKRNQNKPELKKAITGWFSSKGFSESH